MGLFSIADILRRIREQNPEFATKLREAKSLECWPTAVGPIIAKHARALFVREGQLFVEVDHPAWKNELQLRKRQILDKIKALSAEGKLIQDFVLVDPRKMDSKKPEAAGSAERKSKLQKAKLRKAPKPLSKKPKGSI